MDLKRVVNYKDVRNNIYFMVTFQHLPQITLFSPWPLLCDFPICPET
jgi:hypothetical protein